MSVRVHWLWPGPWLAAFDIYRNAHAPSTPPPFPPYNADICVCFLSAVRTHMLASQTGFSRDDAMQFRLIVINIIFVRAFAHLLGRPFLFYFLWWFAVYWCLFHTRTHTSHTSEYVPSMRCDTRGQQKSWPKFVDAIALALAYSVRPCLGMPCHVFVYASMLIMCPCINERSALATHAARPCLPDKKQTDRTSNEQNILLFFLPLSLALFSLSAALTRNLCRTVNFTTNYKLNIENRRRTFFAYYLFIDNIWTGVALHIYPSSPRQWSRSN